MRYSDPSSTIPRSISIRKGKKWVNKLISGIDTDESQATVTGHEKGSSIRHNWTVVWTPVQTVGYSFLQTMSTKRILNMSGGFVAEDGGISSPQCTGITSLLNDDLLFSNTGRLSDVT